MRYSIVVMTAISGCIFCFIMILSTLSPFPQGDVFNSAGMWVNITFILFFYIVSLLLYVAGLHWIKYVMAVFCGIGLLTSLSLVAITLVSIAWMSSITGFRMVLLLSVLATLVNICWYIAAFRKGGVSRS